MPLKRQKAARLMRQIVSETSKAQRVWGLKRRYRRRWREPWKFRPGIFTLNTKIIVI